MSRGLIVLIAIVALLVATNPSRGDFDVWLQGHVARAIDRESGGQGNPFMKMLGNVVVSALPVERKNFVVFSIYNFIVDERSDPPKCSFLGIAGQFIPFGEDCKKITDGAG